MALKFLLPVSIIFLGGCTHSDYEYKLPEGIPCESYSEIKKIVDEKNSKKVNDTDCKDRIVDTWVCDEFNLDDPT